MRTCASDPAEVEWLIRQHMGNPVNPRTIHAESEKYKNVKAVPRPKPDNVGCPEPPAKEEGAYRQDHANLMRDEEAGMGKRAYECQYEYTAEEKRYVYIHMVLQKRVKAHQRDEEEKPVGCDGRRRR